MLLSWIWLQTAINNFDGIIKKLKWKRTKKQSPHIGATKYFEKNSYPVDSCYAKSFLH